MIIGVTVLYHINRKGYRAPALAVWVPRGGRGQSLGSPGISLLLEGGGHGRGGGVRRGFSSIASTLITTTTTTTTTTSNESRIFHKRWLRIFSIPRPTSDARIRSC